MAASKPDDLVFEIFYNGIKRGVEVALDNRCFSAAVTLIYSGIDTVASYARPAAKPYVDRSDFIDWCDRYIKLDGDPVQGVEWYAARCAVLHTLTTRSRLSNDRSRAIRIIGYRIGGSRATVWNPAASAELLLVSIEGLAHAFFAGIDRCLIDIFKNDDLKYAREVRLHDILCVIEGPS